MASAKKSSLPTSIIVDAWTVTDGSQAAFLEMVEVMFERLRALEGFLEGEILQGVDPTRFLTYVRMRSAHDRDRAMEDHGVKAAVRQIRVVAQPHVNAYTVLRSFGRGD
jgi:heme-degrading monooxygenase HmoA